MGWRRCGTPTAVLVSVMLHTWRWLGGSWRDMADIKFVEAFVPWPMGMRGRGSD